jgi:hypothetical protein
LGGYRTPPSAASLAVLRGFRSLFLFFDDTAAGIAALASQQGINHRVGASHAGFDRNGLSRAILHAGPAFHAGIPVFHLHLSPVQAENPMGADLQAHPAPNAFFLENLERGYVFQIDQAIHFRTPLNKWDADSRRLTQITHFMQNKGPNFISLSLNDFVRI